MQDPPEDEGAVTEALARRDYKQALTLLMGLHGTAIYNYCRHLLGNATRAEDVLQTTFAQAFVDLPRYQGKSTLRVWLFGIARHRCLDTLKMDRRRENHIEPRDTLPDAETNEPSGEDRVMLASNSAHLIRCLEKLTDQVRDAILQRFLEQLSYEEMSLLTGERAATLQMRVARAMPALRRCLEESGVTS